MVIAHWISRENSFDAHWHVRIAFGSGEIMAIPTKISELVERFDRNLEAYKQGKYNETQVRLEFINPFFEELGWDITNKQGYAEAQTFTCSF